MSTPIAVPPTGRPTGRSAAVPAQGAAPSPTDAPARVALRSARTLVEPALLHWVDRLPGELRRIARYHFGWNDAAGAPDQGLVGKALRPALVLAAAEACGGRAEETLAPAVAVELVHNFSLLHDDILDGDTTRRHRATAWTVFGSPGALLTGDALLSHAFRVLADEGSERAAAAVRALADATTLLVEGEHTDVGFESRETVPLQACLSMSERKTAELLACSCELGALWAGAAPDRVAALRRFGHHLGLGFQLADDLLGIWGDPALTGKPAGADLAARKKSLPVAAALAADGAAARRLAALYRPVDPDGPPETADQLAELADLVERAGGRGWAERAAEEHAERAATALAESGATGPAAEALAGLAALACRRDT
ncbi:polyprenyl synthetase family protein [Streptomyces bohaiensis]|uniref:polyprenyl synthetase family protein n=1 Tax=Streptomyces bohaiensis TaxID=1431344 RepID=UPI003B79D318